MQGSDAGAARAPGGRGRAGMRARRPRDRARRAPPTYMLRAYMHHDLNVIGAAVVMLGDRIRDATEDASGMGGALPAALSALHEWAGGRTIETLAGGLRLSHSRTVRVVDKLEARGLARRERDPGDGRGVLVRLTPAGDRVATRVLAARAEALEAALAGVSP